MSWFTKTSPGETTHPHPGETTAVLSSLADEDRAFQARAAAKGKARSPSDERRIDSTLSVNVEADGIRQ